jgi:arsenic resistance protein ArsH
MSATQPLSSPIITNGDLNNDSSMRATRELETDQRYLGRSLAIPHSADEAEIRQKYRPFLLSEDLAKSDWISQLELSTALKMSEEDIEKSGQGRLKVMVLYGSMRKRYSSRHC